MASTINSGQTRGTPRNGAQRAKRPAAGRRRSSTHTHLESWGDPSLDFSADEWHDMVAAAAAHRAHGRGSVGDNPEDVWEAEAALRESVARAECEADEKSESASDLGDHDTWRER